VVKLVECDHGDDGDVKCDKEVRRSLEVRDKKVLNICQRRWVGATRRDNLKVLLN